MSTSHKLKKNVTVKDCVCVYVGVFVYPVAVDITKMISDWAGFHARLVRGTLLGTSTIIQCYPLVRAFHYPPPEDARGCQHVPARCTSLPSLVVLRASYCGICKQVGYSM